MSDTRAGFVAVIGAPNAGKSSLVNALVGEKVSIVTRKVQTTRFPVRGIAMEGEAQIILVDTPGVFEPRRRLDRAMVKSAWTGADDADGIVHVIDAEAQDRVANGQGDGADKLSVKDDDRVIDGLKAASKTAILALNKIDTLERDRLLPLTERLNESGVYSETYMISATRGYGIPDLKARLAEMMPQGPHLYPADQAADIPQQLLAAEITREKVYDRLHQELPYASAVETESWRRLHDGSVRIEQRIYVDRTSQKPIVLGKGGQTIKAIGATAREEMEAVFGHKVHLFLQVQVQSGWDENRARYRAMGLEFDS
ncbi:GTPase Era [Hyphobacterium sp.]|uniref:GTPase Era n=1 Tax=Hyphobacterium sp. TaxID=2004662 RepID=UPI003BABF9E5